MSVAEPSKNRTIGAYVAGVLGTFLIMAGLVWIMYHFTQPPPLDESRYAERRKNLAEINAAAKEQLDNYGWIDQAKGIVRLPVTRGMELTIQESKSPAQARSNLIARLEKATAVAPKAPPAPNVYE